MNEATELIDTSKIKEVGRMGDEEKHLLPLLSPRVSRVTAHFREQEGLELRMEIDLRFVDDEAVELFIVDEGEECEKFLEAVAFAFLEFVFLVTAVNALKLWL